MDHYKSIQEYKDSTHYVYLKPNWEAMQSPAESFKSLAEAVEQLRPEGICHHFLIKTKSFIS